MDRIIREEKGWELDFEARELRNRGARVPMGGRAFEIVEVLANARGELVSKQRLMNAVWPGAIVEDHTLQVHISSVRRALGADRAMLQTASGRGYRLVGEWISRRESLSQTAHTAPNDVLTPRTNIPVATTELVGRAAAVQRLRNLLTAYRAVTLTGPGGIGKTVLALETVRSLFPYFGGDSWLVELGSISDAALVPATIATALDLKLGDDISPESIARAIGSRSTLLLLDNCEHVIESAATVVEVIIRRCAGATILSTSRELLRIEGEGVFRLGSLDVPSEHSKDGGEILGHSAVQLFINRLNALRFDFAPSRTSLLLIASICRRIDGIPLAIEFAAARAAALGVEQVSELLDNRLIHLAGSRRTASRRQQTLQATLDWSYELLSERERAVFRKLSIFAGHFALDAAKHIIIDEFCDGTQALETIEGLIAKSLLTHEAIGSVDLYRQLDMSREYARAKSNDPERRGAARRLAESCVALLDQAEVDWKRGADAQWRGRYTRRIDDIRNSLNWAFSPDGDVLLGVSLAAKSSILWSTLGLMEEHRTQTERALYSARDGGYIDDVIAMRLLGALGAIYFHTKGPSDDETLSALSASYASAAGAGDIVFQTQALSALCAALNMGGDHLASAQRAKEFGDIPGADRRVVDRTLGYTAHFLGDIPASRNHLEAALGGAKTARHSKVGAIQYDQNDVTMRSFLARTLWLNGLPDQALQMVRECVDDALSAGHAISLSTCLLISACPIAFLTHGRASAEYYIQLLQQTADRNSSSYYRMWGEALHLATLTRAVRRSMGLEAAYRRFAQLRLDNPVIETMAVFGDDVTEPIVIEKASAGQGGWCAAEMLRARGHLMLRDGTDSAPSMALFRQALELAKQQGALAWELRAATSLASALHGRGDTTQAKEILSEVRGRFTEGFDSVDFLKSTEVLFSLAAGGTVIGKGLSL